MNQGSLGKTVMDIVRSQPGDSSMVMMLVIVVEEFVTNGVGILEGAKMSVEKGTVFEGF